MQALSKPLRTYNSVLTFCRDSSEISFTTRHKPNTSVSVRPPPGLSVPAVTDPTDLAVEVGVFVYKLNTAPLSVSQQEFVNSCKSSTVDLYFACMGRIHTRVGLGEHTCPR